MTAGTDTERLSIRKFWEAEALYAEAEAAAGLWKGEAEDEIRLFRGEVVENDSPGSGRSDEPGIEPFVQLSGETVYRKRLDLEDPACDAAQAAFIALEAEGNTTTLCLSVNGREVRRPPSREATPEARQYRELSWSRWYYVDIPADALRPGENELTVWSEGGREGWQVMVADYRDFHKGMERPRRPASRHGAQRRRRPHLDRRAGRARSASGSRPLSPLGQAALSRPRRGRRRRGCSPQPSPGGVGPHRLGGRHAGAGRVGPGLPQRLPALPGGRRLERLAAL